MAYSGRFSIRKGTSLFGYTKMDMGIAKLHFEIGAGKENFKWAELIHLSPNSGRILRQITE